MIDSVKAAVLVVEDDFFIREQLCEELQSLGFDEIGMAADLRSGAEVLDSGAFTLAILDVNLGNELVFPLAERIAQRQIPIIFCTAVLAERMPEPWSGYPILKKPVDWSRFAALVRAAESAGSAGSEPFAPTAAISPRARAS